MFLFIAALFGLFLSESLKYTMHVISEKVQFLIHNPHKVHSSPLKQSRKQSLRVTLFEAGTRPALEPPCNWPLAYWALYITCRSLVMRIQLEKGGGVAGTGQHMSC